MKNYENLRTSRQWIELKRKILSKSTECELCKGGRFLTVHHIKPVSQSPDLFYDEVNLQVLCETCHGKIHHICVRKLMKRNVNRLTREELNECIKEFEKS